TIASTSQFVHPKTGDWSKSLLKKLDLPTHFLPEIVPPGTTLGKFRVSLAQRTGLTNVNVVTPPSHDTASAVVGVPTSNTGKADWAYLSSGTWSLIGVETKQANLSPETLVLNMTNEGGVDGTYRLLKNIMGLWLVQQCKRVFDARGEIYDYGQLVKLAMVAKPLRSLVNPNDPRFLNPPNMAKEIQNYCRDTEQPVPQSVGEIIRCAYESLALKYRDTVKSLEVLTGESIRQIHIVGGGSQNQLLNQFTADACQRPVVTGPIEATALGNLLVQVQADGELKNLSEIRAALRASSEVKTIEPIPNVPWREGGEPSFGVIALPSAGNPNTRL
ncbi:MAG: FGGY-family carbohydrate kinase, partial [Verrucomicrobiota bacterium]